MANAIPQLAWMAQDDGFPLTHREAVERVKSLLLDPPRAASGPPIGAEVLALCVRTEGKPHSDEVRATSDE